MPQKRWCGASHAGADHHTDSWGRFLNPELEALFFEQRRSRSPAVALCIGAALWTATWGETIRSKLALFAAPVEYLYWSFKFGAPALMLITVAAMVWGKCFSPVALGIASVVLNALLLLGGGWYAWLKLTLDIDSSALFDGGGCNNMAAIWLWDNNIQAWARHAILLFVVLTAIFADFIDKRHMIASAALALAHSMAGHVLTIRLLQNADCAPPPEEVPGRCGGTIATVLVVVVCFGPEYMRSIRRRRNTFAVNSSLDQENARLREQSELQAVRSSQGITINADPARLLRELQDDSTVFSELEQHWFIDAGELNISSHQLGAGGSGQVFAGQWNDTDVAVKQIPVYEGDLQGAVEEARGEVQLLVKCCQHPNIVQLHGISKRPIPDGQALLLVMERCATSLDAVIRINARAASASASAPANAACDSKASVADTVGPLERRWLLLNQSGAALMAQVCMAMHFLHKNGIVHRDLKPGNILLSERGVVKIADFGCSKDGLLGKSMGARGTTMTANVGTPVYMAPELAVAGRRAHYSGAVDVYAFALVAWSVFMAERPFEREAEEAGSMFELMQRVHDGLRPRLDPDRIPAFYRALLPDCWNDDPERRPSFGEVLSRIHASQTETQKAKQNDELPSRAHRHRFSIFKRSNSSSGSHRSIADKGDDVEPGCIAQPPVRADRLEESLAAQ